MTGSTALNQWFSAGVILLSWGHWQYPLWIGVAGILWVPGTAQDSIHSKELFSSSVNRPKVKTLP